MPVYEYICPECKHVTEAIRRMADADQPQPCEKCGGKTTREFSLFTPGSASGSAPGSSASQGADAPPCGLPGGCCGGGACAMH